MKPMRNGACRGAIRGFTLTELMIVVTILGLLLAVSAPAMGKFMSSWRLNGEASKIAMTMRAARSTAVNRNIPVVFIFDKDAGEYHLLEDEDGDGSAGAGERESATQTLPSGLTISEFSIGQEWVTFSPRGSTADGGTITLAGKGDQVRTIRVYSGTGNVSVE